MNKIKKRCRRRTGVSVINLFRYFGEKTFRTSVGLSVRKPHVIFILLFILLWNTNNVIIKPTHFIIKHSQFSYKTHLIVFYYKTPTMFKLKKNTDNLFNRVAMRCKILPNCHTRQKFAIFAPKRNSSKSAIYVLKIAHCTWCPRTLHAN